MAFRKIENFDDFNKILSAKKYKYSTGTNWTRYMTPTSCIVIYNKAEYCSAEWPTLLRYSPDTKLGSRNFYDFKEDSWDKFLVDEENSIILCPETRIALNY